MNVTLSTNLERRQNTGFLFCRQGFCKLDCSDNLFTNPWADVTLQSGDVALYLFANIGQRDFLRLSAINEGVVLKKRVLLVPDFNLTPEQPFPLADEFAYPGINDKEQRFRLNTDKDQELGLRRGREITVQQQNPAGREACADMFASLLWWKPVPDRHVGLIGMGIG